jgi:hypothetical protein
MRAIAMIVFSAALICVGCSDPDLVIKQPTQLHLAKQRAMGLEPGMTKERVQGIMGRGPDETALNTYGAKTASGAWQGLEWKFKYQGNFKDNPVLEVIFSQDSLGTWVVNHYRWSSF